MKRLTAGKLFVLIVFIAIFTMTVREISDNDYWWHLRTGQLIFETRSIPKIDPYSYTKLNQPWVTHEWLTELLMYLLFRLGGTSLSILFFAAVITISYTLVFLRSRMKPYLAGFILMLGVVSSAPTWGARPQMLSMLFSSLYIYLLDKYYSTKKKSYLFLLPFIMILWVNMHGSYPMGILIFGIYFLGNIYSNIRLQTSFRSGLSLLWKNNRIGGLFLICCLVAIIFNPSGLKMLTYPFETLTSPTMQTYIQEWFSPNFHLQEWQPFAILILLLIGAGLASEVTIDISEIALIMVFLYAALKSMRHVYFFSLVAIPAITYKLTKFELIIKNRTQPKARNFIINICLLIFVIIGAGARVTQVLQNQSNIENSTFPVFAVDWIMGNKPQGNLFNAYDWGGYLIWRLSSEYKIYIDGRADIYGDQSMIEYANVYSGKDWQTEFDNEDIRIVLVKPDAPIASILSVEGAWKKVFEDKISVVFVKQY